MSETDFKLPSTQSVDRKCPDCNQSSMCEKCYDNEIALDQDAYMVTGRDLEEIMKHIDKPNIPDKVTTDLVEHVAGFIADDKELDEMIVKVINEAIEAYYQN